MPCRICEFVLNGADQYQDHLKGKRHRKNLNKQSEQGRAAGKAKESSSVRPASPSTTPRRCELACGGFKPLRLSMAYPHLTPLLLSMV